MSHRLPYRLSIFSFSLVIFLTGCNSSGSSESKKAPVVPPVSSPAPSQPGGLSAFNLVEIASANQRNSDQSGSVKKLSLDWTSVGETGVDYTVCRYDSSYNDNCHSLITVTDLYTAEIELESLTQALSERYFIMASTSEDKQFSNEKNISAQALTQVIGYFKASFAGNGDQFGYSVAVSDDGNTIAIGAPGDSSNSSGINSSVNVDGSSNDSGAVYVFESQNGIWSQTAYLKAQNSDSSDAFGESVTLNADGTVLAVGAIFEDSNSVGVNSTYNADGWANYSGAVYVYHKSAGNWNQTSYLKASNAAKGDFFGESVALNAAGDVLAVGASNEDSNSTGVNSVPNDDGSANDSGAVYLFKYSSGNWSQTAYLKPSNIDRRDYFGRSLSISDDGNTLAIGANGDDSNSTGINSLENDDGSSPNSGAVYIFTNSAGTWAQSAYIKAFNPESYDVFGYSVALSGNGSTLAVGAMGEDSRRRGVNSTAPDDSSAVDAGAVYLYQFEHGAWQYSAYVKASNTGEGDYFGYSIALDANARRMVISANNENSNSTGINSSENDDGTKDVSGAAYVFENNAGVWRQISYLKAGNTGERDNFGQSVAISATGNTLAVGAYKEDSNSTGINSVVNDNGAAVDSGAVYVY